MDGNKLVKMANEIGAFFAADPDPVRAVEGIAGHLRRFWDPRMRRDLLAFIDQNGDAGLTPIVRDAIARNRAQLTPPTARTA